MVSLAKKKADGVLFFMRPLPDVDAKSRQLASSSFKVCANVVACVSSDYKAAERNARRSVAFYLTYGEPYRRLAQSLAVSEVVREAIAKVRKEWLKGRREDAAGRLPEELLREVAIYGRPSDCKKAIEEYSRIKGLHMLGLRFSSGERSLGASLDSSPLSLARDDALNLQITMRGRVQEQRTGPRRYSRPTSFL